MPKQARSHADRRITPTWRTAHPATVPAITNAGSTTGPSLIGTIQYAIATMKLWCRTYRDCIGEIEPTDGGDAQIRMKDGGVVPCSRRFRDNLRSRAVG